MVSAQHTTRTASRPGVWTSTGRLPAYSRDALLDSFSAALDLAEGKPMGHARRVAYIALVLADAVEADPADRGVAYRAALLHDLGMTTAAGEIQPALGDDQLSHLHSVEGIRAAAARGPAAASAELALHRHVDAGAVIARGLGLSEDVAEAIRDHHEWWDGSGYLAGLSGKNIPLPARLVTFADAVERVIGEETSTLAARYRLSERISALAGRMLDPAMARSFIDICQADPFWIELTSPDLPSIMAAKVPADSERVSERRFLEFAESFSRVVDAKDGYGSGHSVRVGGLAERLARATGMTAARARHVRLAGVFHDLGHMGVPNRVTAKPNILSVEEMDEMRAHPWYALDILSQLPGMNEIAVWAAAHHERIDGRGYPNMLSDAEILLGARIVAIADMFDALMVRRPHRNALSVREALAVMDNAAGTQFDVDLYKCFQEMVEAGVKSG